MRSAYLLYFDKTKETTSADLDASIFVRKQHWHIPNIFTIDLYGIKKDVAIEYINSREVFLKVYANNFIHTLFDGIIKEATLSEIGNETILRLFCIDKVSDSLKSEIVNLSENNISLGEMAKKVCSLISKVPSIYSNALTEVMTNCHFSDWSAWESLEWLVNRDGSFFYIKNDNLVISNNVNNPTTIIILTDADMNVLRQVKYITSNAFYFECNGNPLLLAGSHVNLPDSSIAKNNYVVLEIEHLLNKDGKYISKGIIAPLSFVSSDIYYFINKSAELKIKNKIRNEIDLNPSVITGKINNYNAQFLSNNRVHNINLNMMKKPTDANRKTNYSTETPDGFTGVSVNSKPIVSLFAYDDCGIIIPRIEGQREVLLRNLNEKDDLMGIGSVWTKNMKIPNFIKGDFLISLPVYYGSERWKGNSQFRITRNGKMSQSFESIKIVLGKDNLTRSVLDLASKTGVMEITGVINKNFNKVARYLDKVKVDSTTDQYRNFFVASFNAFKKTWDGLLTTLIGTGGSPAGVVAYAGAMQVAIKTLLDMPVTITGRIDEGSDNVYVG